MWGWLVAAAFEPFVAVGAIGRPASQISSPSVLVQRQSKYSRRERVGIERVAPGLMGTGCHALQPETETENFSANDESDELDALVVKQWVSGDAKTSISGQAMFRLPVSDVFLPEHSDLAGRMGDGSMGYCWLSFEKFPYASQICSAFSSVLDISQFPLVYLQIEGNSKFPKSPSGLSLRPFPFFPRPARPAR